MTLNKTTLCTILHQYRIAEKNAPPNVVRLNVMAPFNVWTVWNCKLMKELQISFHLGEYQLQWQTHPNDNKNGAEK
jgi:hypothetical protein